MTTLTPRQHALRFRIWQFANERGWEVACADIAEHIGESTRSVARIVQAAGWSGRVRRMSSEMGGRVINGTPEEARQILRGLLL